MRANDESGPKVRSGFRQMNFHENSYVIVFGVAEYESGIEIQKFKMMDAKWWSYYFGKRQNLLNFS